MKGIFVGIAGGSAQSCLDAVKSAVKQAEQPARLAFGICPGEGADPTLFFKAAGPAACRLLAGEGLFLSAAWQTVYGLYGGQEYALQVTPESVFQEDWDRCLIAAMGDADADKPLLTSFLSQDGVPQAVAVKGFTPQGSLQFAPGMKVLHAQRPPRSFFLCPDLVFGAGEWMRAARENAWNGTGALQLTMHAYAAGFTVFVPNMPAICRNTSALLPEESLPQGDWAPVLQDFEADSGVTFESREVDAKARLGLYTQGGRYTVQLSLAEGLRQLIRRRKETARVMLATAMGRHEPRLPLEAHLALFTNLAELARLSLCCYCPPEWVKRLQQILPNTYARQEAGEGLSYDSEEAFLKSKPYFIAEAEKQFPSHTHYGWIDMDYVKHPVHSSAVFLWDELTDGKIHLAQAEGRIDAGLVVVPREKVEWLLRTASVLNPDPAMGCGDEGLFRCLAETYPDEFTLHPMEKKHMLLSQCQPLISGGMLYDA